jgi:hypothetical protein
MMIYNVTSKIDWSIADAWVEWMQQVHIPDVVATGCFTKSQFVRLMDIDEKDGPTYAAQYYAESQQKIDEYIQQHATVLRKHTIEKWGDKFIAFRTLMQVVN